MTHVVCSDITESEFSEAGEYADGLAPQLLSLL